LNVNVRVDPSAVTVKASFRARAAFRVRRLPIARARANIRAASELSPAKARRTRDEGEETVMAFEDAPPFLISAEVRAKRYAAATKVAVRGRDGARDEIEVPAGHWVLRDEDGVAELPHADFEARFVAVPPDPLSFALRGRPARALRDRGSVRIQGREAAMTEAEFAAAAVRLSADGRPLCRLSAPLAVQARQLLAAGAAAERHLADLRETMARLRAGIVADPAVGADLAMADAVLSGRRDAMSDGMAEIHGARPPEGVMERVSADGTPMLELDPASVRGRLAAALGVSPGAILDVVHVPGYGTSVFRALGRAALEPYLGGRAMEDVLSLPIPPGEPGADARRAAERWLRGAELLVEGPEVAIPEMPDYLSSPVRHYRSDDGLDVVAFSDLFGSYIYAWRSPRPEPPRP
jgi:hypothetical protein